MKKLVVLFILFFVPVLVQANDNQCSAHAGIVFIENKGQVADQYGKPRRDIDYKLEANGVVMFAGNGQLHYEWFKDIPLAPFKGGIHPFKKNSSLEGGLPKTFGTEDVKTQKDIYRLDVELLGANSNAEPIAEGKQAYYENYYLPATPNGATAYSYKKITYKNVYPYIDWVLYVSANSKSVKYDFVVHPGGNPADIRIQYNGATKLEIKEGALTATTPYGSITEDAPYSYYANSKEEVATKFVLNGNILTYNLPSYTNQLSQHTNDLVIDPILRWATYYGGSGQEDVDFITADTAGNVYLCGSTNSISNIATSGGHQTTLSGGFDALVAKFDITGVRQWATYYGGTGNDVFDAIDVEPNGVCYVSGYTRSTGLGTAGTHQPNITTGINNSDGLLVKFNTAGIRQWATYYGDTADESLGDICYDKYNNCLYLAGGTSGSNKNISTAGSYVSTYPSSTGQAVGFITKFSTAGTRIWASYYYGAIGGLSLDAVGNIYACGFTHFSSGVATPGAYRSTFMSSRDLFICKFSPSGAYLWGTYYGNNGNGSDGIYKTATDANGNVYAVGQTRSATNISTPGSHQPNLAGIMNGFMVKFNGNGTRQWATYYGGTVVDCISDILVSEKGEIWIAGTTGSTSGIATPGSYQPAKANGNDLFFALFNTAGQRKYASYYGGNYNEPVNSLPAQATVLAYGKGKLYFANHTASTTGIATPGAHQTTIGGSSDYMLVQFDADTTVYIQQPFTDTLLCSGDVMHIKYGVVHNFLPGNTFTIQLSDSSGSFATPATITTITGQTGGQYNWTIPSTITYSKDYRIRIVASAPAYTHVSEFTVSLQPKGPASLSISSNPASGIWKWLNVTFTAWPVNGGNPTYQWKLNGTDVPGATARTWSTTTLNNNDKVSCTMVSDMFCATTKNATSNTLTMVISGVAQLHNPKLKVYPNPANEVLHIEGIETGTNIQLTDMPGRVVYSTTSQVKGLISIPTKELPAGNYVLQLVYADGTRDNVKIVKE